MNTEPIKTEIDTEADYEMALEKIERLFGSAIGSTESSRLEALVTLVQEFEARNYHDPAIKYETGT